MDVSLQKYHDLIDTGTDLVANSFASTRLHKATETMMEEGITWCVLKEKEITQRRIPMLLLAIARYQRSTFMLFPRTVGVITRSIKLHSTYNNIKQKGCNEENRVVGMKGLEKKECVLFLQAMCKRTSHRSSFPSFLCSKKRKIVAKHQLPNTAYIHHRSFSSRNIYLSSSCCHRQSHHVCRHRRNRHGKREARIYRQLREEELRHHREGFLGPSAHGEQRQEG